MEVNVIRAIIGISMVFIIACSSTKNKVSDYNSSNLERCKLFQNTIGDIPEGLFSSPFDSLFNVFKRDTNEMDFLFRQVGQQPKLIKLSSNNGIDFNRTIILKDKISHADVAYIDGKVSFEGYLGEHVFLCNVNSTDIGSQVFIVKKKGIVVGILWLDNGRIKDIDDSIAGEYPILDILRNISMLLN